MWLNSNSNNQGTAEVEDTEGLLERPTGSIIASIHSEVKGLPGSNQNLYSAQNFKSQSELLGRVKSMNEPASTPDVNRVSALHARKTSLRMNK